jgi:hypothetical protein
VNWAFRPDLSQKDIVPTGAPLVAFHGLSPLQVTLNAAAMLPMQSTLQAISHPHCCFSPLQCCQVRFAMGKVSLTRMGAVSLVRVPARLARRANKLANLG